MSTSDKPGQHLPRGTRSFQNKRKLTTHLSRNYVLVTGATGFIGAHVVDQLLSRGLKVRGATRSMAKGNLMIQARPKYADRLDFVEVDDFEKPGRLHDAVKGVDAVIHVASVGLAPPSPHNARYMTLIPSYYL